MGNLLLGCVFARRQVVDQLLRRFQIGLVHLLAKRCEQLVLLVVRKRFVVVDFLDLIQSLLTGFHKRCREDLVICPDFLNLGFSSLFCQPFGHRAITQRHRACGSFVLFLIFLQASLNNLFGLLHGDRASRCGVVVHAFTGFKRLLVSLDLFFKLGCTRCHLRTLGRSHRLRDFADLVHNFGRFAAEHGHIRDKTGYSHGSYGERCTNGVCCNERS
ncbi:Uncharacterised protein [Enterobacter hormaechei]|nr:Uncharacterised protein [Enterobacter hormaechei]